MGEESGHPGLIAAAGRSLRSALAAGSALTIALLVIDYGAESKLPLVSRGPARPHVAPRSTPALPPEPQQPYRPPVWRTPPQSHRFDRSGEPPTRHPEVMPVLIESVPPRYTQVAQLARISGIVILEIVIESDGTVSRGRVLKPLPFGLTASAIEAVRHYRFRPGMVRGRPVPTIMDVAVKFQWTPGE